jgi:hypothetical protein
MPHFDPLFHLHCGKSGGNKMQKCAFLRNRRRRLRAVRNAGSQGYLAIRADPPFMARSTSASVAMLVSPGVVIASAPCATPHFTAHSTGFPARNP